MRDELAMNSEPAFQLRLFGSPSIAAPDGVPLTGAAVQRHRVALLAVLALAGGRAVTREKLMGYLWPDRDSDGARQLLNQAVYALRKALGDEALLSDGDDLRLNADVLQSDTAELEAALARSDHERAIRLYSGPLLDGFFLNDAPEFDRLVEQERLRLARAYAKALEALAETAERNKDPGTAAEWWRKRATQDPYDTRVAMRLMQALAASGNRAAAIQYADIHERLLEQEFGAAPPPEVRAFAERLRNAPTPAVVSSHGERRDVAAPPIASTSEPAASTSLGTRRIVPYAVAGFALAGLALAALRWSAARPERAPAVTADHSIAVLPLANLSTDTRDAALADGMTEELTAILARSGGVHVIASTSAFALRGRGLDARSIAESLHVGHIVEGGVQKDGSRLRVQIRLVDARDGSALWSERYDRELRDVFAVQDDIARAVARELSARLGLAVRPPARRRQAQNLAAYELYLRGNDPALIRSDSGAFEALKYFRQAIALDSGYAAAHAGLARMYMRTGRAEESRDAARRRRALAEQTALKAIALDDSLAEAHATLGLIRRDAYDLESAEAHLTHAVELEPSNGRLHEWLAQFYVFVGRPADALREARRGVDIDPLSPSANAELARALVANGRCDEALVELQKVAALQPPLLRARIIAAQCYMQKQMWPEATAQLRAQLERGGSAVTLGHLGYVLARANQPDEARRIDATLRDRWRRGAGGATAISLVEAGLGNRDSAFAWLDRAIADRAVNLDVALPLFAELRSDPRFEQARARVASQKR